MKTLLFIYLAQIAVSVALILIGLLVVTIRSKKLAHKYGVAKSFESDISIKEFDIVLVLLVPFLNLVLAGMVLWISLSDVGGEDL